MGSCPFPYMLAAIAPFLLAIYRTAGRKPPQEIVKPIKRVPGQFLPRQKMATSEEAAPPAEGELAGVR